MTKTASVSLFGNHYEVDALLVGESVELVFDSFDLADIEVHFRGRPVGRAGPRHIGRHVHPHVKAAAPEVSPTASGIDYLRLVERRRAAELARRIDYRDLAAGPTTDGDDSTDNDSTNTDSTDRTDDMEDLPEHRPSPPALGLHPRAVHPGARPLDAVPVQGPRRGGGPHQLARLRAGARDRHR